MKALREELIDFVRWLNTPSYCNDIPLSVIDDYLKSINSKAGDETPTVTDNEAKRKKCNCTKFPRPLYWERGKWICGNCDGLA